VSIPRFAHQSLARSAITGEQSWPTRNVLFGLLLHACSAAPPESTESVPVLGVPEQFLDQLATTLRESGAGAARPHAHPRVRRGATARLHGDVRLDASGEQRFDEVRVEEPLVGAKRRRAESQAVGAPGRTAPDSLASRRSPPAKVSTPSPSKIRWRFSMRALTV
jgi:hypothetical protein